MVLSVIDLRTGDYRGDYDGIRQDFGVKLCDGDTFYDGNRCLVAGKINIF